MVFQLLAILFSGPNMGAPFSHAGQYNESTALKAAAADPAPQLVRLTAPALTSAWCLLITFITPGHHHS